MQNPQGMFRLYCRDNGMRYTRERDAILHEAYCDEGHFDVDTLFLRIRSKHPDMKLAKASVYRTLPHLIRAGLVRASLTDHGHVCYEHTLGHEHHDHMKCIACGKILEFYDKRMDRIQSELCERRDFEVLWHTHVINGHCAQCRRNKEATAHRKQADTHAS